MTVFVITSVGSEIVVPIAVSPTRQEAVDHAMDYIREAYAEEDLRPTLTHPDGNPDYIDVAIGEDIVETIQIDAVEMLS